MEDACPVDRHPSSPVELSTALQLNCQNHLGQKLRNSRRYLYIYHVTGDSYIGVPDNIPRLNVSQALRVAGVLADNPLNIDYTAARHKLPSIIGLARTGKTVTKFSSYREIVCTAP